MISSSASRPGRLEGGFTFVSLLMLVVFAAWAIANIVAVIQPGTRTAAEDLTEKRFALLKTAATLFKTHSGGTWPANLDALVTQGSQTACAVDTNSANTSTYLRLRGWCGPYIDQPFTNDSGTYLQDGYGTNFVYNSSNGTLRSCGKDRDCNATADDRTLAF